MSFTLRSDAFDQGAPIPQRYAYEGEGDNHSPPLRWEDPPAGTQQFALLCEDPDAPRPEPWVHWVCYGIPADRRAIDEDDGGRFLQGPNDFGAVGWGGPLPPPGHGTHHYHFRLYALDEPLDLDPGLGKQDLLAALDGHVLDTAELMGTYERPG